MQKVFLTSLSLEFKRTLPSSSNLARPLITGPLKIKTCSASPVELEGSRTSSRELRLYLRMSLLCTRRRTLTSLTALLRRPAMCHPSSLICSFISIRWTALRRCRIYRSEIKFSQSASPLTMMERKFTRGKLMEKDKAKFLLATEPIESTACRRTQRCSRKPTERTPSRGK